jgi:replicative DNA helicase
MNSELLDRMPPASLDSERGVIGSILLDRRCLGDVAEIVAADDFYADANRRLFATLVAMDFERRQIDVTLLLERLRSNGELEAVGGAAYLAEVLHSVPYAVHASQYARIVREKAVLRAVIDASCDSLRDAYAAAAEPQAILDAAEQRLQAIGARRAVKHATAMDLAAEVTHYIEQARQGRGLGMETGFPVFDKKFGGLFGGEFIVLAARPAVGKSALASQIADYNASSGRLTYVVSLEMSGRELALRSVCREAGVNGQTIRAGRLDDEAVTRLTHKINLYSRKNLLVDRGIDMTVEVLARSVRRLMPRGLTLVVVDYLSLLTASDQRQPRHEQVANQSRALKQLARETQLPIVVLCQLNRSAE